MIRELGQVIKDYRKNPVMHPVNGELVPLTYLEFCINLMTQQINAQQSEDVKQRQYDLGFKLVESEKNGGRIDLDIKEADLILETLKLVVVSPVIRGGLVKLLNTDPEPTVSVSHEVE